MNVQVSRHDDRLVHWIAAALLLISFGLGDAAVVVWSAALASLGQLAVVALAFVSTGIGVLFTVWQMGRSS